MRRSSIQILQRHFDELAPRYDGETSWRLDPELLESLSRQIPAQVRRAVDLGCGTGVAASLVRGAPVVGVDLSFNMLRAGRVGAAVCADVLALPVRSGAFDLVVVRQLLQYVAPEELLPELARVTVHGAYAVVQQFVVAPGAHREWWAEFKRHTQPLRRRVLFADDLDQAFATGRWCLDSSEMRHHPRTVDLEAVDFNPSPTLASRAALRDWVCDTWRDSSPEANVTVHGYHMTYLQTWTVRRYVRELP